MSDKQLKGIRVAILATNGFEESELLEPRKALDEAGAQTTVIAPQKGEIQGMQHDKKASKVKVDDTLNNASPAGFERRASARRGPQRRRPSRRTRRTKIRPRN